jgi:acyl-CoA reductase-like NAD-dependent aldehyde dehydrogenase
MQNPTLLIGGRAVAPSSGQYFERIGPVAGAVASRAAAADVEDAMRAAEEAHRAFPSWSAVGPTERRRLLLRTADLLEARTADFERLMLQETGATPGWANFNVALAANMLREAAAATTHITGHVVPSDVPGSLAFTMRVPAGVVLGIAPWNAPVILGVRAVAMPLACGNTVILKASEICPGTHRLIGQVLCEAGLPDGVVNVITHAARDAEAVSNALIAHPAVRRINFTGSTHIGTLMAATAAKYLKPILLELGGKAPIVVLEEADVCAAVDATVFGAYANSGQICMSSERAIVHERIADEFAERLARRVSALPAGDPSKGAVVIGPMIGQAAAERLRHLVADAEARGARVLTPLPADGTLVRGLVIDHVTPAMRIFHEETFGPQVSITRFRTPEEAISLANDSAYGLSSSVFSRDIARAMQVAQRIQSGICHINGPTVHDEPQMPFGGTKASGYGRFGGTAAIAEFTELRWMTIQTTPRSYPF